MGGSVEFPSELRYLPGLIFLRPTANPAPRNVVFLHATEPFGGLKVLVALFRKVGAWNIRSAPSRVRASFSHAAVTPRAAHCGDLPAVRWHRGSALRIRCRLPFRHSDNAAMEIAEASRMPRQPRRVGSGSGPECGCARGQPPRIDAGTARAASGVRRSARPRRSGRGTAPGAVRGPVITPKARVVRIRKASRQSVDREAPVGSQRSARSGLAAAGTPALCRRQAADRRAPPATMPRPPRRRKQCRKSPIGQKRAKGRRRWPVCRRRKRSKRRFALPASRRDDIENDFLPGARSGRTIGARPPPPSMTDAAPPVVHMRARVLCRSEAFGTGRDNILACSQEATAVCASDRTASSAYALISSAIHRHRAVGGAHVYPRLLSRMRMAATPLGRANPAASKSGSVHVCKDTFPLAQAKHVKT